MKSTSWTTHENCEGSISLGRRMRNSKKKHQNARNKLKTAVAPAMLCKIMKKNCGSGGSNKIKTRLACIREADKSTRLRLGESLPNFHEDHVAGKERIHYSTTIWFTNLFLCLKLKKFLQRKQRWTMNGKNWRKFRRGT